MKTQTLDIEVASPDGHAWTLLVRAPEQPRAALLWVPALGVAARHYLPFAEALAGHGIAVGLHEWRGHGSSTLRAGRHSDWGYKALLEHDLPASQAALAAALPQQPLLIGGHSLGGQLAACHAALSAETPWQRLWLVASGTPYWRCFPGPRGWLLPLAYRFMRWLAQRNGALPGRRIGFGGNEARGVIYDWSRVGLSGRYAGRGMAVDLEQALSQLAVPVDSVLLAQDWFAPAASLKGLTDKFRTASAPPVILDAKALGTRSDHFAWMQDPQAIAAALINNLA
ncbi:Predicted alpha/beta hydrolase [Pseudoxanthomonas sp. GM95]|uniref:alpha/beta hydrolase family protein n=1 Tax=Pseudoxanthomonas sp. GM95 TaxID=1881043 RepID=UPI0008BBD4CD|nr:alpha/beta hydrolase [Pseudoxanthomonas sp. GM95]SEK85954.1 Predicted alpha/beta hydrolase [Pseudoxanthomonas sp. GM95]